MKKFLPLILTALVLTSCRVSYSFSGTSIEQDVRTISIELFEYKAMLVNPTLSNEISEALRTQFRKMTPLEQVESNADMELSGAITNYTISAQAISAAEQATQNRLTVTVSITFINNKHPESNVESSFSAFADFPATTPLSSVESSLCQEIITKLVDEIFNATVAQW